MKKAILGLCVLLSTSAVAEQEALTYDYYAGAGFGSSEITNEGGIDLEDNFKVFWGFKFNDYLSLDQAYGTYGVIEETDYNYEVKATGLTTQVVASYPNDSLFTPYAKLGLASWRVAGNGISESGTGVAYGVGAGLKVEQLTFKVEIENIDLDGGNLRQTMATVQYNF